MIIPSLTEKHNESKASNFFQYIRHILIILVFLSINSYLWKATSVNSERLEKLKSIYFVPWDQKLQILTFKLL